MKIGSVRFFKVLILVVLALLILIPSALAVWLGVRYNGQKSRADNLEEVNRILVEDFINAIPPVQLPQSGQAPTGEAPPPYSPAPSFAYQTLYPHLYAPQPDVQPPGDMMCYLTFDDGPSSVTRQVLKVLDQYGIQATFFVTGKASELDEDILREAALAGHTIGVHSYSHEYGEIYASVEAFLEDFDKMYRRILEVTGASPTIFRFAGGSVNVHNQRVYTEITAEMLRRGFLFYDWNVAASDAVAGGIGRAEITGNVLNGTGEKNQIVVLMHDRADNAATAAALPGIIEGLQAQGYRFAPLTPSVPPVTYYYAGN